MKEFLLSYRKTFTTHSIALIVGFTIAYFIFTSVDYTKIENKTLELENKRGQIQEQRNELTPASDLEDALKSKDEEIIFQNDKINQLLNENKKLRNEKINNVNNMSNDDMVQFITEWAKRNGSLPR